MIIPPGTISYAETIWKYFSPSKSPFYAVIVVAIYSLCWSHRLLLEGGQGGISAEQFYAFLVPIAVILAIALLISFRNVYELPKGEHDEQILFTRSFCISVALVCMVWNGHTFQFGSVQAKISYWSCILQVVVFLVYTCLRLKREQAPSHSNLIQLGLITGAFMIGFSYCLQVEPTNQSPEETTLIKQATYILDIPVAFWALYLGWLICIYKWIDHFVSIIRIDVKDAVQTRADDQTRAPENLSG